METNETPARQKKIFIAAIIALAITSAVTGGLLINEHQHKVEITAQKEEVDQNYSNLEKDYHDVTSSLDAASLEIGQLKGKNAELDKIITDKQAMIEQEKKDLDEAFAQNKLTAASLNKAHVMISKYESSIADLQKQVAEYAEQNKQLIVKTEELTTDLTCEKETTTALTEKNENLTQKINEASYLQIPAVEVAAVKKNIMGNEVTTSRVRAAESLKICFETGANKALDPGKVSLYVRIINPKGETIAVHEQGSGVIPMTENGKPVQFTKRADIQWNQKSRKVVMYWQRYIQDPGTYKVEVYQSGKVVGRGAVKLV
jgi:predicted RNase H-like nuclease (RuvC/YqgF family)